MDDSRRRHFTFRVDHGVNPRHARFARSARGCAARERSVTARRPYAPKVFRRDDSCPRRSSAADRRLTPATSTVLNETRLLVQEAAQECPDAGLTPSWATTMAVDGRRARTRPLSKAMTVVQLAPSNTLQLSRTRSVEVHVDERTPHAGIAGATADAALSDAVDETEQRRVVRRRPSFA